MELNIYFNSLKFAEGMLGNFGSVINLQHIFNVVGAVKNYSGIGEIVITIILPVVLYGC